MMVVVVGVVFWVSIAPWSWTLACHFFRHPPTSKILNPTLFSPPHSLTPLFNQHTPLDSLLFSMPNWLSSFTSENQAYVVAIATEA